MMKGGWEYKKLGEIGESELGKTKDTSRNKGILHPHLCAVNVLWTDSIYLISKK